MSTAFDASAIERHGWRQGAVLGANLAAEARKLAPSGIVFAESDWLIVTSHDCDVVNGKLEKEPTVALLQKETAIDCLGPNDALHDSRHRLRPYKWLMSRGCLKNR